jgi:hypothetical protein
MMSQSLTPESLLDRFDISPEDLALLKECGRVIGPKIDGVVDRMGILLGRILARDFGALVLPQLGLTRRGI